MGAGISQALEKIREFSHDTLNNLQELLNLTFLLISY